MKPLYTEEEFDKAKSRQPLLLQCLHCGKTFHKPKHRIQEAINPNRQETLDFCSRRCKTKNSYRKTILVCKQCGKDFLKWPSQIQKDKNNFCSRSCSASYSNSHKTKGTRCSKLEKWLQVKLPEIYPNLKFQFNKKNAINSELDIYIPSLRLAFELNGIFHYEPIYGSQKLMNIQNNDQRKFAASYEKNIELCIIDVSRMSYFKEQKCIPYLEIIKNIISLKISRVASDSIPETT